ncbi:MAG TPA: saccharopine dehydrogenase NADP-binding domain-containing protein [Thermoanaerobaculia bacterium]|jgi:saccharopine dehydrogenase-like NADP-dependent oxidoreductase|nr:saccharopine dehydrogenase NADP-binding domain-containing protein [Thermoanaerobaculia bacterium]
MSKNHQIVIAGAGGMGSATGLLLRELGDFEADLFIGDSSLERAQATAAWIREGSTRPGEVHSFHLPAEGTSAELEGVLAQGDILLDCLPGKEAPRMARLARKHEIHYANLTEHVKETEEILEIADGARQGFLLQTGLAPGYIDVLGHHLFQDFCREHGVESADCLEMRVGALTTTVRPPHFYGFTWSSVGVATEYVEPATVLRDHRRTTRPSLADRATVILNGVVYEEALTSGGAADLPVALAGKVRHLDYKTLRYPGHYDWIEQLLQSAPAGVDLTSYLLHKMEEAVPFVDDDLVVTYAAVEGRDGQGLLRRAESTRLIRPRQVGARKLKAIQGTTAAGLAESARFLLTEDIQGVCLQSQIDPAYFMAGPFVSEIYHR